MTEYEKFEFAVDLLVEANEQFRKEPEQQHLFAMQGPIAYAFDQATIRVNSNRRAGKTRYVNARAKEGDLVVVGTPELARIYNGPASVWIADPFKDPPTERFNRIYVDVPFLVFDRVDAWSFYRVLCKDADQTFIFLGRN